MMSNVFRKLWNGSAPLTAVGLGMLVVALASLVGVFVDPRVITGAPAWLKPLKFAISTSVYSLTLAWIFGYLHDWPRTRRVVGWVTAIVFVLEVAIIDLQAGRGTTSHFNAATTFDQVLYGVMGGAIMLQTLISIAVAVALWRQRFADRALGWALRIGMTITIAGALTGPLMTRPTAAQLEDARAGHGMTVVGAHTVGGVDGGPGLPITGWSREHGDVRVPHFVGLHAIQALGLLALALRRSRRSEAARARLMIVAGIAYAALFGLLLAQALAGRSVLASPEVLFRLLNGAAMLSWVALIVAPRARWAHRVVPIAVPALLALAYVATLALGLPGNEGSFASLAGVGALFASPWALLAGWTHYLAFDLFVGGWIVRDAQAQGVPHLAVVPALVGTFLAGPAGFLLYLAIRAVASARTRSAWRASSSSPST